MLTSWSDSMSPVRHTYQLVRFNGSSGGRVEGLNHELVIVLLCWVVLKGLQHDCNSTEQMDTLYSMTATAQNKWILSTA